MFFFLMIRRPPRSTLDRSSAASDVYKRQIEHRAGRVEANEGGEEQQQRGNEDHRRQGQRVIPVSYTHLRAHETVLDLVCRLLLEKKKNKNLKHIRNNKQY
mgnify:CR=1 FL=1